MIHRIPEYQYEEYAQPLKLSSSDSKYHIVFCADDVASPTRCYNLAYDGKTLRKIFYATNGTIGSSEPTETSSYAWVRCGSNSNRGVTFINSPVSAGSFNGGLNNYIFYNAVRGDGSTTIQSKKYARPIAFLNQSSKTWYVAATIILQRTTYDVGAAFYYNIDRTSISEFNPSSGTYTISYRNFTKPRTYEGPLNVTTATITFTCEPNKGFYFPCVYTSSTVGTWAWNNDYIAESYIGIST